jgi:hypothetical protein
VITENSFAGADPKFLKKGADPKFLKKTYAQVGFDLIPSNIEAQ